MGCDVWEHVTTERLPVHPIQRQVIMQYLLAALTNTLQQPHCP